MKNHINYFKKISAVLLILTGGFGSLHAQSASIDFQPATVETQVGEPFFVEVHFDTDNVPISVFDLHMLFDPAYLEVMSIEKLQDGLFNYHVEPSFDNEIGKIDMAAFQIGKSIPESFSVIKMKLMPISPVELTEVVQNTDDFPESMLAYGGHDFLESTGTLEVHIADASTGVDSRVTDEFGLNIWPNPSSDFANIAFSLKDADQVNIRIFDPAGKLVQEVYSGSVAPGVEKTIKVDLRNLASGNYTCRLSTGNKMQTQKLNVIQ